jgi:hypothetical protein
LGFDMMTPQERADFLNPRLFVMGPREGYAVGGAAAVPSSSPPAEKPLTAEQARILLALQKAAPMALLQADLSADTDLSERTIRKCLKVLRERNLTCRAHGKRKGEALTPKGMVIAAKLPRS